MAGDGAFVHGAAAAACKGELAALGIARQMGCISRDERRDLEWNVLYRYDKSLAPRDFIDRWFAPSRELYQVADDVVICRCEGVTAGRIREAVSEGCLNANDIKIRTRCGMGPCQGRMCGPGLCEIAAGAQGISPGDMVPLKPRSPLRPVPFGEFCTRPDYDSAG